MSIKNRCVAHARNRELVSYTPKQTRMISARSARWPMVSLVHSRENFPRSTGDEMSSRRQVWDARFSSGAARRLIDDCYRFQGHPVVRALEILRVTLYASLEFQDMFLCWVFIKLQMFIFLLTVIKKYFWVIADSKLGKIFSSGLLFRK